MSETHYLQPIALTQSPQAEDGAALRLAGGLAYASRFALIERRDGAIVSRRLYTKPELEAALPGLPPAVAEQWANLSRAHPPLQLGARTIRLDQPQVVGILNVTPDSFSDGGEFLDKPEVAQAHAAAMLEAGAAIIDIGGESTRPGAAATWEGDELKRVIPMVEHCAKMGAAISVDTRRVAVMEGSLAAGAQIINDVSALRHDARALAFVAAAGAPVILMHAPAKQTGAAGEDVLADGVYDNVVLDVFDWLAARRDAAISAGVAREKIILDPGIGFGKTLAQNLALINALPLFHALGQPLMLGASRKRMIGALSNEAAAHQRLGGSLMLAARGLEAGVQLLRVHDVAETVQMARVWRGLRDAALVDFSSIPA